jgi:enediyne biosynthesis protein E4
MRHVATLLAMMGVMGCGGRSSPATSPPDAAAALVCGEPPHGEAWTRFANVTATSGIEFMYTSPDYRAGGIAAADLDGDGLPDVIAGLRTGGIAYFHNLGGMRFQSVPPGDVGLDPSIALSAVAAVDLDNDGDTDLVLAGPGDMFIMANQGNGSFYQVAHFEDSGTTEQVLAVDLNGDGLLDLFLANRDYPMGPTTQNRLYMNRGNMQFDYVGTVPPDALSWTATAFDYDGDGDQDIYLSHDTLIATYGPGGPIETADLPPDSLLRNDGFDANGVPQFTDIAATVGMTTPRSSMSGMLGDLDGDGQFDIYVTNIGRKTVYAQGPIKSMPSLDTPDYVDINVADWLGVDAYLRTGDVDVPEPCGPSTTHEDCLIVSWSAVLTDFDLDGYDELLVVNGSGADAPAPPPSLFVRGSALSYHEMSVGLDCPDGHGLVTTDLDGDGDQDVLIAQSNGQLFVIENTGTPGPGTWLDVTLTGGASNRQGIGAVVTVQLASGRTLIKAVGAGGVINTSNPPEAFFGLGSDTVAAIDVAWPSGRASHVTGPSSGRVRVVEP